MTVFKNSFLTIFIKSSSVVDFCIVAINFHDHEEVSKFSFPRLLVDVDEVVNGQYSCTNILQLFNQLRELYLDFNEIEWNSRI